MSGSKAGYAAFFVNSSWRKVKYQFFILDVDRLWHLVYIIS